MTRQEFTDLLRKKGYSHKVSGGGVVVTHHGYVNLSGLTTLPEGIKFENRGSVYLGGLTTLPEGIKFENHGSVDLRGLTTLPEGIKFENHGSVDLDGLTTLPEGIKFENHGYVYLRGLTGQHIYLGKTRSFEFVDGYSMITGAPKSHSGYTVKSARYLKGGSYDDMPKCYIAYGDGQTAHGKTIKSAIEDMQYKIADNDDKSGIAAEIVRTKSVTLAQFRGITGACREGIREHLSCIGIDLNMVDSLPLDDALKAMAGTSFGQAFSSQIEAAQ